MSEYQPRPQGGWPAQPPASGAGQGGHWQGGYGQEGYGRPTTAPGRATTTRRRTGRRATGAAARLPRRRRRRHPLISLTSCSWCSWSSSASSTRWPGRTRRTDRAADPAVRAQRQAVGQHRGLAVPHPDRRARPQDGRHQREQRHGRQRQAPVQLHRQGDRRAPELLVQRRDRRPHQRAGRSPAVLLGMASLFPGWRRHAQRRTPRTARTRSRPTRASRQRRRHGQADQPEQDHHHAQLARAASPRCFGRLSITRSGHRPSRSCPPGSWSGRSA